MRFNCSEAAVASRPSGRICEASEACSPRPKKQSIEAAVGPIAAVNIESICGSERYRTSNRAGSRKPRRAWCHSERTPAQFAICTVLDPLGARTRAISPSAAGAILIGKVLQRAVRKCAIERAIGNRQTTGIAADVIDVDTAVSRQSAWPPSAGRASDRDPRRGSRRAPRRWSSGPMSNRYRASDSPPPRSGNRGIGIASPGARSR